MSAFWPDHENGWPTAIVPIAVNVLQFPVPTPRRLYKLGQALRRAVESWPQDKKVVVLGTGGLSHQLHGERFGFKNADWDHEFLSRLDTDPESLASLRTQDYIERGGAEGAEMVMWLAMRGALSSRRAQAARQLPRAAAYGLRADPVRRARNRHGLKERP